MISRNSENSSSGSDHLTGKQKSSDQLRFRRMAWILALAGFLPFGLLAAALFILSKSDPNYGLAHNALATYGAVILSFLGGIRWGAAMRSPITAGSVRLLLFAVVPSLIGWLSLYLSSPYVFAVQALAFAGQGAWDAFAGEKGLVGLWYVKLRTVLTLLVSGSLIAAFFATA